MQFEEFARERATRLAFGTVLLAIGGWYLVRGYEAAWLPDLQGMRPKGVSDDLAFVFVLTTVWLIFFLVNGSRIVGWLTVCVLAAWTLRAAITWRSDGFGIVGRHGCIECQEQPLELLLAIAGLGTLGVTAWLFGASRRDRPPRHQAVKLIVASCAIPCWVVSVILMGV